MHCCYSRKKRARARERESVSGEESKSIATHHHQRIDIAIARYPSFSFFFEEEKKAKKKTKTKRKLPIDQAKDDDVNKNDLRKRTLAERPAKDNCWCSNARKRGERVGQSSRPRVARAFSKSTKKNFSYHPRERGDHRSFLPSNPSHSRIETEKKNEPQTGRIFGNARRTLARDVRAMPAKGASSRAWSSSSKQKSSSHRGSHHVLVVSRCVFLKWRTRDCFFFSQKHREETERERERERERETRGGKDATQTHVQKNIIQPFFFINFETLKSNAMKFS